VIAEGKSETVSFPEADFQRLLGAGLRQSSIINLELADGKTAKVVVKEIQRHPVSGKIFHVDFYRVQTGKRVRVKIAVEVNGISKGVKAGGALEHFIRVLRVRATPESLLDVVKVDVTGLDVGQAIHLKDLSLPSEWEIAVEGNPIVVKVARSRVAAAAEQGK
jgi:large subunit ribosomal protein L25